MSLSSIVKRKEVREELRKHITFPQLQNPEAPVRIVSNHPRLAMTGTAFDYALRVILKARFPQSKEFMWISQQAVMIAQASGEFEADTIATLMEIVEYSKTVFARRKFIDEFAIACINLANIDVYVRTGSMPKNIPYHPTREEIDDVLDMCKLAKDAFPLPQHWCLLNPSFGKAAELFKGADPDLVIDGALIDIKTTKNLLRYSDHIFQLVGYIICAEIDGGVGQQNVEINRAGFYFARHGLLELWDVEDIISRDSIIELADFFRSYLGRLEEERQYDF